MKIVIDIPEEIYNDIQSRDWENGELVFSDEWKAIHNGTPLPKGHGRFIDADKLNKCIVDQVTMPYVPINKIQDAPTIIEADKED